MILIPEVLIPLLVSTLDAQDVNEVSPLWLDWDSDVP